MRIALYILLGILAFLLLLCFIPISLFLRYEEGEFTAWARVLGIKIKLYPEMAARISDKKDKTETEKAEPVKPEGEKKKVSLGTIASYINPAASALVFLLKGISVKRVVIRLIVDGAEPYDIGKDTGTAWAVFGAFSALLQNTFRTVKYDEVTVIPDFAGEYNGREKFSCKLGAITGIMVAAVIVFIAHRVKQQSAEYTENQNSTDGAKENENG